MFRRCIATVILFGLMLSRPHLGSAYEEDVHFYLTYVLCRLAGFTDPQAYLVARADQSLDDNSETTAFDIPIPANYYSSGEKWHALNTTHALDMKRFHDLQCSAEVHKVINRKQVSLCESPSSTSTNDPFLFVRLGQFIHYFQDTYSHSNDATNKNWGDRFTTFGPLYGHFFLDHQPDRVPNDESLAATMANDIYSALQSFADAHGIYKRDRPPSTVVDSIVEAIAKSYVNLNAPPQRLPNVSIPSFVARGGPSPPRVFPAFWDFAEPARVRCNISKALRLANVILNPDVSSVVYATLRFDAEGNPGTNMVPMIESPRLPLCSDPHAAWGIKLFATAFSGSGSLIRRDYMVCNQSVFTADATPQAPQCAGSPGIGGSPYLYGIDSIAVNVPLFESSPCVIIHPDYRRPEVPLGTCISSLSVNASRDTIRFSASASAIPTAKTDRVSVQQILHARYDAITSLRIMSTKLAAGATAMVEKQVTITGTFDCSSVTAPIPYERFRYSVVSVNPVRANTIMDGFCTDTLVQRSTGQNPTNAIEQLALVVGKKYLFQTAVDIDLGTTVTQGNTDPSHAAHLRQAGNLDNFTVTFHYRAITPDVTLQFNSSDSY